jgi:NADPH2:quinone reductase
VKALRFHSTGDISNLHLEEVPKPVPGRDEMLVRVHAASINPSDVRNVQGKFRQTTLPRIPGRDLAGVVVAGSKEWVGQEVWATGGDIGFTRDGSHAEYIVLPERGARLKPSCLSMIEAASAGVNYVTAYTGLITRAQLKEGSTVMVTGAAGGVGSSVIKIARTKSCRVIAIERQTMTPDQMRRLGVDLALCSQDDDVVTQVIQFTEGCGADVVFDCVGGPLFELGLKALGNHGRQINIVSVGTSRVCFDLTDFYHKSLTLFGVDSLALDTVAAGEVLEALRPSFEQCRLTPPDIGKTCSLEEAKEAYREIDRGAAKGKIVIEPSS